MNLSCGNCKAIRTFSGDPPKCDVCGWVCGTSEATAKTYGLIEGTENLLRGVFRTFIFAAVVAAVFYIAYLIAIPDKQKLAIEYKVGEDKVFIEPKPHGCDFDDAPLGNKHCHFEKQVDTARECASCPVTAVYVSWRKVEE